MASFVELSLSPGKNHRTWNLQHSQQHSRLRRPTRRPPSRSRRDAVHVGDDRRRDRCETDSVHSGRDSTPAFSALARPPPRAHEVRTQHEQPRAASPSGARAAAAVPDVERTCGHSHWARLTEGHRSGVSTTHCVCKERPGLSRVPSPRSRFHLRFASEASKQGGSQMYRHNGTFEHAFDP